MESAILARRHAKNASIVNPEISIMIHEHDKAFLPTELQSSNNRRLGNRTIGDNIPTNRLLYKIPDASSIRTHIAAEISTIVLGVLTS